LRTYLSIIQILIASALIAITVLQGRGAGLGSLFGGDSSIYRTRRGIEKTLFNLTIILAVIFAITSLLNVLVQS